MTEAERAAKINEFKAKLTRAEAADQPAEKVRGLVEIPAASVDGELSVEKAIDEIIDLHPGADRLAMQLLAACFTHPTVRRYRATALSAKGENEDTTHER
jgi:hypothetical protein